VGTGSFQKRLYCQEKNSQVLIVSANIYIIVDLPPDQKLWASVRGMKNTSDLQQVLPHIGATPEVKNLLKC